MIDPIAIALAGVGTSPMLMATDGFIGAESPPIPPPSGGGGGGGFVHFSHYRGAHRTFRQMLIEHGDMELIMIARAFIDSVLNR